MRYLKLLPLFLVGVIFRHSSAVACQVPVFRYALERWQPQAFAVVVFHRGALSTTDSAAVHSIDEFSPAANLQVLDVDLDAAVDDDAQKLWQTQKPEKLPWIVIQVPGPEHELRTFWSGPLDATDFKQLVDSPLRRSIGRHLVEGDSAVWMLIEGGNAQRDDAAFQLLAKRLKKLERDIVLPIPDPASMATDLPLKLSFPLVRVSRNDPAENLFLRLLAFRDKNLTESADPVVIPIFGRGRALGCLSGDEINPNEIDQAGFFLGGQCSCEVKEQNPGYDLLMAIDWNSIFREHAMPQIAATQPSAPPLEPRFVASASLSTDALAVAAPTIDPPSRRRTILLVASAIAAIFVVLFGWLTLRPRTRSNR